MFNRLFWYSLNKKNLFSLFCIFVLHENEEKKKKMWRRKCCCLFVWSEFKCEPKQITFFQNISVDKRREGKKEIFCFFGENRQSILSLQEFKWKQIFELLLLLLLLFQCDFIFVCNHLEFLGIIWYENGFSVCNTSKWIGFELDKLYRMHTSQLFRL